MARKTLSIKSHNFEISSHGEVVDKGYGKAVPTYPNKITGEQMVDLAGEEYNVAELVATYFGKDEQDARCRRPNEHIEYDDGNKNNPRRSNIRWKKNPDYKGLPKEVRHFLRDKVNEGLTTANVVQQVRQKYLIALKEEEVLKVAKEMNDIAIERAKEKGEEIEKKMKEAEKGSDGTKSAPKKPAKQDDSKAKASKEEAKKDDTKSTTKKTTKK